MVRVDPHGQRPPAANSALAAWSRAPGPLFHTVGAVALLLVLWGSTYPAAWPPAVVIGGPALVVLSLMWLAQGAMHLWVRRRRGRAPGPARSFVLFPAVAVPTLVLALSGVPFEVRWARSEAAFDREAAVARATSLDELNTQSVSTRRIGLYRVDFVYRNDDGVFFREAGGRFFEGAGFACLTDGVDAMPKTRDRRFNYLGGCWYTWTRPEYGDR